MWLLYCTALFLTCVAGTIIFYSIINCWSEAMLYTESIYMFRENFIHRLKHSLEFPQLILLPFFNRILNNQNIPFINYQNALSIPMSSILSTSFEYVCHTAIKFNWIGTTVQTWAAPAHQGKLHRRLGERDQTEALVLLRVSPKCSTVSKPGPTEIG